MPLSSATHREAVNLIATRRHTMTLELRSTGMIPVKERRGDPITWVKVDERNDEARVVRVVLDVNGYVNHLEIPRIQ